MKLKESLFGKTKIRNWKHTIYKILKKSTKIFEKQTKNNAPQKNIKKTLKKHFKKKHEKNIFN